MADGDRGVALPSSSAHDSGDSVPTREKDWASQAHVQSKRHSGLTLWGPGCGTGRRGPCDCAGMQPAGPSVDTIPTHVSLGWGPELATSAVAWLGPCPSLGAAGDDPVECSGRSAERLESPEVSPSRRGTPCWRAQQRRLKPDGPGRLKACHARAARSPLLSLPSFLVGCVGRRVCIPIPLYLGLILVLPGSQNWQECPTWPESCLLVLATTSASSPTVLEAYPLCPLSLRVSHASPPLPTLTLLGMWGVGPSHPQRCLLLSPFLPQCLSDQKASSFPSQPLLLSAAAGFLAFSSVPLNTAWDDEGVSL